MANALHSGVPVTNEAIQARRRANDARAFGGALATGHLVEIQTQPMETSRPTSC